LEEHITPNGELFLKACTAMPDFNVGACEGIPDNFEGLTVCKQDALVHTLTLAAQEEHKVQGGSTYWFAFMPTPGVAYWQVTTPFDERPTYDNGGHVWNYVPFPETEQLFPQITTSDPNHETFVDNSSQVSEFRYVGLAGEIISTTNEFKWAGNIIAGQTTLELEESPAVTYIAPLVVPKPEETDLLEKPVLVHTEKDRRERYTKYALSTPEPVGYTEFCISDRDHETKIQAEETTSSPPKLGAWPDGGGQPSQTILTGINGIVKNNNANQVYTAPTSDGVYSVSMSNESTSNWAFKPIRDDVNGGSVTFAPFDTNIPDNTSFAAFKGPMLGMGHFPTIWMKFSVPYGADPQSVMIRSFAEIEYVPVQGSLARAFATPSPKHDPAALCQYALIAKNIPVGVPSDENAKFWQRVLQIVRGASSVLSELPGEFGEIARGVNLVTKLL
jgi:hypothetical protein